MLRRVLPVLLPVVMLLGGALIALAALLLATAAETPGSATAQDEWENVPLVVGCNPVAITYPDNTPIGTIAGAVSPPEILISIWRFDEPTVKWLGYSPVAPARASDLTEMDRLNVAFLCVNPVGTFTRPVI